MADKIKLPDPNNVEELKLFFKNHEDYTLLEISLKNKIKPTILKKWRIKAGVVSNTPQSDFLRSFRPKKKIIDKVTDPAIWDNREWFVEAYSKHGIVVISRIIGKSIITVQKRLNKYGIKTREWRESIKSKNPYNTDEWVIDCYFHKKIGIKKMATIAGVSIYTIYDWLIARNIYPRSRNRASALRAWKSSKNKRLAAYNRVHGTSFQSFEEVFRKGPKNKEGST